MLPDCIVIGRAVGALDGRRVAEAVAGVDPAVEAPGEGVGHAVRVAVAEGRRDSTSRWSALPSPSVSLHVDRCRGCCGRAPRCRRSGRTPIGMFRPSAKVVILRARPSGPKSARILTVSRGGLPSGAGKGIRRCR